MPVQHGSQPGYLQRTTLLDDFSSFPQNLGSSSNEDSSLMMQEAGEPLRAAGQDAELGKLLAVADVTEAANAEASLKDFMQKGQAAQEAQTAAMAHEEQAAEGLSEAIQRVQRAGSVEEQEVAVAAEVANDLKGAEKSAEAMQAVEKDGGVQELKAAQLLEAAIRNLQIEAGENAEDSVTVQSLKAALQAQNAVAVAKSQTLQHAALLQQSLQGAASAVQSLKTTKEAQTSNNLLDAYKSLQGVRTAWDERTLQEVKAAKSLEDMMNDTRSIQKVAQAMLINSSREASLMQNLGNEVHAAEDGVIQDARKARSMRDGLQAEAAEAAEAAARAEKSLEDAALRLQASEASRQSFQDAAVRLQASEAARQSLQDATLRLQASEAARQSETAKAEQLSHYMQSVAQSSVADRSMPAAQLPQLSSDTQADILHLAHQINQFGAIDRNAAAQLPVLGMPSNLPPVVGMPPNLPPNLAPVVGMPPNQPAVGMPPHDSPQNMQAVTFMAAQAPHAAFPDASIDQRFPGISSALHASSGSEAWMPPGGSWRAADPYADALRRR